MAAAGGFVWTVAGPNVMLTHAAPPVWTPTHAQVTKYHESALIEAQILQDVNSRERNSRRDSSLCVEMFNQLEHQVWNARKLWYHGFGCV